MKNRRVDAQGKGTDGPFHKGNARPLWECMLLSGRPAWPPGSSAAHPACCYLKGQRFPVGSNAQPSLTTVVIKAAILSVDCGIPAEMCLMLGVGRGEGGVGWRGRGQYNKEEGTLGAFWGSGNVLVLDPSACPWGVLIFL